VVVIVTEIYIYKNIIEIQQSSNSFNTVMSKVNKKKTLIKLLHDLTAEPINIVHA